jgi:cation diffusion facilitator CzcD-associated flavoprotein CzcO
MPSPPAADLPAAAGRPGTRPGDPAIVIVGAGMAGICMAITLKRAGSDSFLILEQSPGVGGTWWDNTYPGAQCDVPSHLYSLSCEPKADWSRVFAESAEIQRYVAHCVRKYDLERHLRLGTRVTEAQYDDAASRWQLTTNDGQHLRPRFFVLSLGPLNHPRYPAGIDAFRGEVMHSARWNHAYDFRGRRVAVIGSAASAVQIVPTLARQAAALTIYQRSPSWIVRRPDRRYSALEKQLFRLPALARAYRWLLYWQFEARFAAFKGRGLMYRLLTHMARSHLKEQVHDAALRARLRPAYPMGCKRILISSDFYPALAQENVELVAQAATAFTADGVVSADGAVRRVDAIVCATGFNTLEPLADLPVRGRDGRLLAAAWRDGPEAYRGVLVAGFPNLFMLLGPNTGTGHTSVLIPIEAQARYTLACIEELDRRGAASLDVRPEAMAQHNAALQKRLARTVWASPACTSWYKNAAGKVLGLYPGHVTRYVLEMRRPRYADFVFH